MTPLRAEIRKRKITSREVAVACSIDPGQFSRMERGLEAVTPVNAERISRYFGGAVTEMQILYPERYESSLSAVEIA